MGSCYAFWKVGCAINWVAWGAIGSMLAAIVAIAISVATSQKVQRERRQMNSVILSQLYAEARQIYWVADWFGQLKKQIEQGAIPASFDPVLKPALRDIQSLSTRVYDRFGHHVPSFSNGVAGVLIAQYSAIQSRLASIERALYSGSSLTSLQKQFDYISGDVLVLRNSAFNIVCDLANELGYKDDAQRQPGPERYTSLSEYEAVDT